MSATVHYNGGHTVGDHYRLASCGIVVAWRAAGPWIVRLTYTHLPERVTCKRCRRALRTQEMEP